MVDDRRRTADGGKRKRPETGDRGPGTMVDDRRRTAEDRSRTTDGGRRTGDHSKSAIRNPQSAINESEIRNPKSEIGKSAINESAIRNPKSAIVKTALKRVLFLIIFGSVLAFVFFFKDRLFSRALERNTSDEVLIHIDTTKKVLALTIDDGPHAELTPEILDVLAEYAVPVTFFVLGERIPGNEVLLKRMVAEGHELGNHLMEDQRSIQLEPVEFTRQLSDAHRLLRPYGPVRWFRPGSGWYNTRMLAQIRPFGYRCVLGSVYPYDAQIQSVEFAAAYILGNVRPGSIIILHDGTDGRQATPEVLRRILPALLERGYRFDTLSGLV